MKPTMLQKLKSKWSNSSKSSVNSSHEDELPKWYKETYTRLDSEQFLMDKEVGVFVIRKSETHQDCYVLSVRVPKYMNHREISHYLIVSNSRRDSYCVKGFQKEFTDLKSLVTHCSLMRDIIPVMLNVEYFKRQESAVEHRESDLIYCFFSSPSTSTSSLASIISSQSELSECESV